MSDAIQAQRVTFPSGDINLSGYLARPAGAGPWPAVLVVHHILGVNAHMEDVTTRFPPNGYVAFTPDLYSRGGAPTVDEIEAGIGFMENLPPAARGNPEARRARLQSLPDDERATVTRMLEWMETRDQGPYIVDLKVALTWLQQQPFVSADRIAALGFCMGGSIAARLAVTGADLAACVIYYGENPPLDLASNIRCPVLGLYGAGDHRITDNVPQLVEAMRRENKSFEYHVYPGAAHAFNDDTRQSYRPEAAADAWQRTLAFLSANLGKP